MVDRKAFELDAATLRHAIGLLEARLQAVVTYGAGGCASCHDAELRGAISLLKRLVTPRDEERRGDGGGRRWPPGDTSTG